MPTYKERPLFNVGDPVWGDVYHEYDKVKSVESDYGYPVRLEKHGAYTLDGRFSNGEPQTLTPTNFSVGDEVEYLGLRGKLCVSHSDPDKVFRFVADDWDSLRYIKTIRKDGTINQYCPVPVLRLIKRAPIEVPDDVKTITKEQLNKAIDAIIQTHDIPYADKLWSKLP